MLSAPALSLPTAKAAKSPFISRRRLRPVVGKGFDGP